jgi:two-component system response regulator AtoC
MKKALVIDDDELDLELLRRVLTREGYVVYATADGAQGITLFEFHRPALVFLDLRLPSMSGMEVLRLIRSIDESANVLLISGYGTKASTEAALRLGAMEFIEKTAQPEKMIQNIRGALRRVNTRLAI